LTVPVHLSLSPQLNPLTLRRVPLQEFNMLLLFPKFDRVEAAMRLAGRERLGFYPLPVREAGRIRRFLVFPDKQCCALDPCVGDGVAFAEIASGEKVLRYSIELDAGRTQEARTKGIDVIHGNCFDVQCPVESFSLIYLNPPYDFEISEEKSQRMEKLFLEHMYRWLKPLGVLVLVVPAKRIADCAVVLSRHFRDVRVYRLTEPESVRYQQVVVFGLRRTRQERDRLRDNEIIQAQLWLGSVERKLEELPQLPAESDHAYPVPPGEPVRMVHRGLPLDEIEDLLPKSSAYRQASAVIFAQRSDVAGRPLTPLHGGHVGLLCTAGMLNGIFGEGESRHLAYWQSVKLVDKSEEEEDGKTIIRERERFSNELTLIFCTGEIAVLK
jgi:SAM-dependent methyltransferase